MTVIHLKKFIYLFLAVLGLRFCARAFSSCGEWGPLFITVRGPLTIAASLVAEHRLQTRRLSSCGSRAQLLHGMWDLPRPGLEPVSPALAGDSQPLHHQGSPTVILLRVIFPILPSPSCSSPFHFIFKYVYYIYIYMSQFKHFLNIVTLYSLKNN